MYQVHQVARKRTLDDGRSGGVFTSIPRYYISNFRKVRNFYKLLNYHFIHIRDNKIKNPFYSLMDEQLKRQKIQQKQ